MEKKIDAFIERLSAEQVRNLAENIYENEAQRENLRLYLKFLCKNKPIYMVFTGPMTIRIRIGCGNLPLLSITSVTASV